MCISCEAFDELKVESCVSDFPLEILRSVAPDKRHVRPKHHKRRRSQLYGWCKEYPDSKYSPARLRPFTNKEGIVVDPYTEAVKKLHQEYTPPIDLGDEGVDWLLKLYPRRGKGRVLSWDETIKGYEGYRSINCGTASGYPWCLNKLHGKAPHIVVNMKTCEIEYTPEIIELMDGYVEQLKNGVNPEVLWLDTLKDELRETHKVEAGKTRLFATCPLHYLLLMRKYLGDITEYMQSLCVENPISVGIDPHSIEWTMIFNRLSKTKGSKIGGDFSNYDGMLPRFVGEKGLEFVNRWYDDGEENARIRTLLFEHIYNATRINEQYIYQVKDGNPSGNPWTSWYNSICQLIMWHYILVLQMGLETDTWNIVVYGDDNVLTTDQKGLRVSDFQPYFKKYFGMSYTHWSKKEVDPHDELEDIRYLGRLFKKRPGCFYLSAPLELSVIIDSTYWVQGKTIPYEVLKSTLEAFTAEIFHYGKDEYRYFCDSLSSWCVENLKERSLLPGILDILATPYDFIFRRCYGGALTADQFKRQSLTASSNLYTPDIFTTQSSNSDRLGREIIDPSDTQNTELGSFQDNSATVSHADNVEPVQDPYDTFNMPGFTLDDTLDRIFPIGNFPWDSSQARDTTLANFLFPDILFYQPYIAQKLLNFKYFRCDSIEITVKIQTTAFLYGAMLMNYLPYPTENVDVPNSDVKSCSGLPHMLISANSSGSYSYRIPFICKDRVIDIFDYLVGQMAKVTFMSLVPLTSTTGDVCSTQVFVYARFVNAKAFLPITLTSSYSKEKEGQKKSKEGIISMSLNALSDTAAKIRNIPIVGGYAKSVGYAASIGAALAKRVGLDKPTTLAMTQVGKINPYADINTCGMDLAPKLGFDPSNAISTVPNVAGHSYDEMSLNYVAGIPQIGDYLSIGPSSIGQTFQMFPDSSFDVPLYMDVINSLFAYHSGSMKAGLYMFATPFHSARLVFWINDTDIVPGPTHWEDCYHTVVEVNGDTTKFFSVPYMSKKFAVVNNDNNVPKLFVTVLGYSQPDMTKDTPITIVGYRSAGDDYRWGCALDVVTVESDPRSDFSKEFESFHEGLTGYEQKDLLYGEEYTTLRQLIHRYTSCCLATTTTTAGLLLTYQVGGYASPVPGYTVFVGLEMIGRLFAFWRGSIRLRMLQFTPSFRCLIVGTDQGICAGTSVSTITNPVTELDIPYYVDKAFCSTRVYNTNESLAYLVSSLGTTLSTQAYVLKAAGDDFSFHFPLPQKVAPFNTISEYAVGFGTRGLYASFNDLNT
jgi:hypothetical protein